MTVTATIQILLLLVWILIHNVVYPAMCNAALLQMRRKTQLVPDHGKNYVVSIKENDRVALVATTITVSFSMKIILEIDLNNQN